MKYILCNDYNEALTKVTQIVDKNSSDVQVLEIDENGSIGYQANRENTITVEISTVLSAKKILALALGASKHRVVKAILDGDINTDIPATLLNLHRDVTLICDKASYSANRLGVDMGGTNTKFCVIDDNAEVIHSESHPTEKSSEGALIDFICEKCENIMKNYNVSSAGIGVPATLRGNYASADNVPLKHTNLTDIVKDRLNISVRVSNDANCAALCESVLGFGKDYRNIIVITIGTGIGGGIIINKKIYEGNGSGGEIGDMIIREDLRSDNKLHGTFESFSSATALVSSACDAALKNKDSILYELYRENGNTLDGIIIHNALMKNCPIAESVLDEYTNHLATGIDSLAAIFDPDIFVLAGGITNWGQLLIERLTGKLRTKIPVKISKFGNNIGAIGAALL